MKIRSGPPPVNEEAAKFQVIAPILAELGWDRDDPREVSYEYQVGGRGKQAGKVDIALHAKIAGDLSVVALVEAKAPNAQLAQHVDQLTNYAFHQGVDICVLTTGLEWWLFLPRERGEITKCRFAVLDLQHDSVEQLAEDLNAFLHKEALVKGRAYKKAKSVLEALRVADHLDKEIPKIWNQMLHTPDEELVDLITARVYKKLNLRPEKDQVVAVLKGQTVPPVGDAPPRPAPPRPVPKPGKRPSRKPIAVVLWGERHRVATHKQILHVVADQLYERHAHEFHQLLKVKGRTYPRVALDPTQLAPTGANSYYQVKSSEYYIDSHGSAIEMRLRAEMFLELFGYDKTDLEVLFE